MILPGLYIAPSKNKGRGVYAQEDLQKGMMIETSPVIVMGAEARLLLDQTLLHDYIFQWGPGGKKCCVALGYVSLYNHAYRSNCVYEMDFDKELIRVITVRFIPAGEELSINYNGDWDNAAPVWFDAEK
jgi:uncharacterized protein